MLIDTYIKVLSTEQKRYKICNFLEISIYLCNQIIFLCNIFRSFVITSEQKSCRWHRQLSLASVCLFNSLFRVVASTSIKGLKGYYSWNLTNRWFAHLLLPPCSHFSEVWVSTPQASSACHPTHPLPHPGGGTPQPIRGQGQGWGPIRGRQGVRGPQTGNWWSLCYWVGNRETFEILFWNTFQICFTKHIIGGNNKNVPKL